MVSPPLGGGCAASFGEGDTMLPASCGATGAHCGVSMMRSDSDMNLGDFDIDSALQQMDQQVFQGGQGASGVGMDVDLMDLGMLLDDKRCEARSTGGDGCLAFLPEGGSAGSAPAAPPPGSVPVGTPGSVPVGTPASVPVSVPVKVKSEPTDE